MSRSSDIYVTDCICFRKKIDDIVNEAKRLQLKTMKDVCITLKCGTKCGLCRPYIRKKLYCPETSPLSRSESRCDDGPRVSIPY